MLSYCLQSFIIMVNVVGATAYSFARFGQGSGLILLDNVACVGTESRLIDCPANPIGQHNCAHTEDAGVGCLAPVVTTPAGNVYIVLLLNAYINMLNNIITGTVHGVMSRWLLP